MPVAPTSPVDLLDLIRKSGVVSPERLASVDANALPSQPQKAARILVQKGLITRFQAEQFLAGRHKGFRLGAYAVQDQLGRGGMGAVYLAEHMELHRKVAIKVLVAGKDEDQKLAVERFLREARAVAALDHPNIVRIFDVCRHGDVPYLVMEYVEGDTLQQILDRDGTVPYTTAADYVAQAAAGLQHAHEKGFVHRDIKPSNMIRDKSGTVKILDMGLARLSGSEHDQLTEKLDAGAVVGTADFIAPEQALNNTPIDIRADIYSLGASFFALIIGKPPFEGNTAQKLLHHQMTAAPHLSTLDATLPKGLTGVAARMLAKKPADRFQTPAEVIGALAPWLGNSSRIMAGLSHTKLGQGAELHATLNELARRSSTRLRTSQLDREAADIGNDPADVDPGSPMFETGEIAAAETTRDPRKSANEIAATTGKKKRLAMFAAGLVVLAIGGVGAVIAFGGKPDDPHSAAKPNDAPPTAPLAEPVLYRLDLSVQQPFIVRSGLELNAANPPQTVAKELSKTGPGTPPKDWIARCDNLGTQMEYFSEAAPGGPAIGIRNVTGPGSAMLFSPAFTCPTSVVRLRFEYRSNVRDKNFTLRFQPTSPSQLAWSIGPVSSTGTVWRVEELVIDLKGATAGFFEFRNTDENPATDVMVRNVVITQAAAAEK